MHRIDGPGATPQNQFTEGNPQTAVPATTVTDAWLNSVQEEIAHIIEQQGILLAKPDNTQLRAAIIALVNALVPDTSSFVLRAGDAMTGPLSVPAGATGAQVPQAQEVVHKTGDSITGPLVLDHNVFLRGKNSAASVGNVIGRGVSDELIIGDGIFGNAIKLRTGVAELALLTTSAPLWNGNPLVHPVASSLGADGFIMWSDGTIRQWGKFTGTIGVGQTVTLPTAFPSNNWGIKFTETRHNAGDNFTLGLAETATGNGVPNITLSQFTTKFDAPGGTLGSGNLFTAFYEAIGN